MAIYMRQNAPAKRTQKQRTYNKYYFRMCQEKGVHPIPHKSQLALRMSRYLSWLYWQTNKKQQPITAGVADKCLAQLGAYWVENNISWLRRTHPQIALQLKWYKRNQPSDIYIRKPVMYPLFNRLVQPLLHTRSLRKATLAAGLSIGYFFGARSGEFTCSNHTLSLGDIVLQHTHLHWSFDRFNRITALTIKFEKSKTNQFGEKTEIVSVNCSCQSGQLCGPHIIWHMCRIKQAKFNTLAQPSDPVLLWESQSKYRPLNRDKLSEYMKSGAEKLGLNPKHYALHSLRIGRASDFARAGVARWIIAKWGRWSSDCWEKAYARLDFLDIARITGTTYNQWRASNSH